MQAYRKGQEEMDAIVDGSSDSLEPMEYYSDSGKESDEVPITMPAQGGVLLQPSEEERKESDPLETKEEESQQEFAVESILARKMDRDGTPRFKVRWGGFQPEDDTWEKEENINDCEAFGKFLEKEQSDSAPRRSPRNAPSVQGPDSTGSDFDDNDSLRGRAEMVMAALKGLMTPEERPKEESFRVAMGAVTEVVENVSDLTPTTLEAAMASPDSAKWKEARQKEFDSCISLGVWKEVERSSLPKGTNILPYKDVFKIKVDENGKIIQYKARFTPKGFRQKAGIDYNETFARTAMYKTERLALSLCSRYDNELVQFDVPTAFLNADVEEVVYMQMPKGFGKDGQIVQLLKSLYGLKQAPRNWDRLCDGVIRNKMGWKATVSDPSFYYKRSKTGRLMMLYRFVDDMQGQHHAADTEEFEQSTGILREQFNIKKMQTASWMLGMRITRDRKNRTITLDQSLYVETALKRFGLKECKSVTSPDRSER